MKLKTLSALTLAATTTLATTSVMAWESEDGQHTTSASVAFASDYRFRGVSFNDNKPAISGSFDYGHASGLYAGIWSTQNTGNGEINIYGGYAGEFGDTGIGYDVGALRYIFPGLDTANNNEFYGSLSYSFFSLGYAYDPDWEGNDEAAHYFNLGFDYALPSDFGFFASVGYTAFDSDLEDVVGADESGYADWSVGLTKTFVGFDWSLAYIATDDAAEDIYVNSAYVGLDESSTDDTVLLSVSKSF